MNREVSRLWRSWTEYWFVEGHAVNLALARVLAAGIAAWVLFSRDFPAISSLPDVYWMSVPESTQWRYLIFPGNEPIETLLMWAARLSAIAALIGIAPRLASLSTALFLYHLAPLESIIWTASPNARGLTIPLLVLLICAASPSGDALVVRGRTRTREASARYGWPLRLIQFQVAMVYVLPGVAKLKESGLNWASGDNLRNWMLMAVQNQDIAVHTRLGEFLSASPLATSVAGGSVLLFELCFVAALVRWRGRAILAACAILFHGLIYFAMNITLQSWPLLLVFFDASAILNRRRP